MTSTAGLFTSSWWLSKAAGTPKRFPAASADSRRVVDSAVISKSSASDLKAGMCACAAHPRSGLAPMMPTRILLSPSLLIAIRSKSRRLRSASDEGLHALASSNFARQCGHRVGEACPDLLVGQSAFLEAGVSMRDGELDIEYPRAERGQDFAELGLRPGCPERAGARTDHENRLVPQHVRRDRARDPVDRILQLARNR